jgi:pyridoxamine 5'-phosphate oxidase
MVSDQDRDPVELFREWLAKAHETEPNDPTAMTLATVGPSGAPNARMVLLKEVDDRGFVFYTNAESNKGVEIAQNPRVSMVFHWKSLRRQVRVDGIVELVADEISDAYFATRARGSQIGAWASDQSRPYSGRFELEKRVARFAAKFGIGAVPRPPFWVGYRVIPNVIEFWTDKPFRLHERLSYERDSEAIGDNWSVTRLFP